MIALSCPQCAAQLEVDDGFRGGVCRCYECGTLMTVPDDPGQEQAEPLFKKSASATGSGRTRGNAPATAPRQSSPSAIQPPASPQPRSAAPTASTDDVDTFETASGKKVRLSVEQLDHIPIASKRKVVRWTTRISLLLIMAGLAGVVLYGAMKVFTTPPNEKPTVSAEEARKDLFKIEKNFFLNQEPLYLGLPVSERNALVIDGSLSMQRYLDWIKIAARLGTHHLDSKITQIAVSQEAGPVIFPAAPAAANTIDLAFLTATLDKVRAEGAVSLGAALQQVLGHGPDQITLVASRLPEDQIKLLIEKSGSVRLVILLIDNDDIMDDSELISAAKQSGGDLIRLPGVTLERWYEEYLDKQASQN